MSTPTDAGPTPSPALPYPDVAVDAESERFWSELGRGRVVLPWCVRCDAQVWPPAARCRACADLVTGERPLPGTGRIHTFSVVHRPAQGFPAPYVLAYVELDGGPVVMANIVDSDLGRVEIGGDVEFVAAAESVPRGAFRFRVV